MAESGSIAPDIVIDVLTKMLGEGNVKVAGNSVTVIVGDNPRIYPLSAQMTRKTIYHIARHSGVPVHLFWNPEMAHPPAKAQQ